jgi:hypothetical protein
LGDAAKIATGDTATGDAGTCEAATGVSKVVDIARSDIRGSALNATDPDIRIEIVDFKCTIGD